MSEVKAKRSEETYMIEFKGELSDECKAFILHNRRIICLWLGLFITTPIMVVIIILTIKLHILFLLLTPCCVGIIISYLAKPKGKALDDLLNCRVRIYEENLILERIKGYWELKFDDITKIIDYGNFYKICFCFPHSGALYPCQKNLITQGSIEEFENLFEGLIVKRKFKYKPKDKK